MSWARFKRLSSKKDLTRYRRATTFDGGGGGGPVPLLDTNPGASVAYSLRLLSSTYSGSAIRVRRSSDNAEQDIGFSGGILDTASLLSFCGAGSGYVTTWYDQSGNTNDNIQSTLLEQPTIVASGNLETINSLPAINYPAGTFTATALYDVVSQSVFTVSQISTFLSLQSLIAWQSQVYGQPPNLGTAGPWIRSEAPNYYRTPTTNGSDVNDLTYNGGAMYFNGSLHTVTDSILNPNILSSFAPSAFTRRFGISDITGFLRWMRGKMSECIVYPTSQESGYRSAIESDMSSHYSISI